MKYISFLIKPASASCNMRCRYCFYADVAEHRAVRSHGIMGTDVMEALIDRALGLDDSARIAFGAMPGSTSAMSGGVLRSIRFPCSNEDESIRNKR